MPKKSGNVNAYNINNQNALVKCSKKIFLLRSTKIRQLEAPTCTP